MAKTTTKKTATKKAATKKTAAKKATGKTAKRGATTAKAATKKAAPKKAKKAAGTTKRKANPAFMKPLTPSSDLAQVVGEKALPRTEVVKKLWAYIKKNNLQDAKNKRNIKADEKLRPIFGGKSVVSMFEMTKLVAGHLS